MECFHKVEHNNWEKEQVLVEEWGKYYWCQKVLTQYFWVCRVNIDCTYFDV